MRPHLYLTSRPTIPLYSLNAGRSEYFLDPEGVIMGRMAHDPRTLSDLMVGGCMMGLPSPTVSLCPPPCPLESTTVRPSPKGLRFPPMIDSGRHSSHGPQQSHVPTWDMAIRPSHVGDQCPDPSALFSGTSCPGSLQGMKERDNGIEHSLSITALGHLSTEGRYGQENGGHRCQQADRYVGALCPTLGLATIQIHKSILEAPAADILPTGVGS